MAKKDRRAALREAESGSDDLMTLDAGSPVINRVSDNLSGGAEPLKDFLSLPIHVLIPYQGKKGSDFSRNPTLHAQMVESIQQHGVIEPLTVRATEDGTYEILAGETRWLGAKDAGLKRVPCHLVQVNDMQARQIFAFTNLVRRDITYKDRINGCWHQYEAMREQGVLQAFRDKRLDPEVAQALSAEGGEKLAFRQFQRYVKCHDLIDEWIDCLDAGTVTFVVAYRIAFFPADIQKTLLNYTVDEKKAELLYKIFSGKVPDMPWNGNETIAAVLGGKINVVVPKKPVSIEKRAFTRSTKIMLCKTVMNEIRDEDFDNVEFIVRDALKMYYEMRDKVAKR